MDEILSKRDKYLSSIPNIEQVKDNICTTTAQIGRTNRDDRDRFLEEVKKLDSLKTKIRDQQERLSNEEQNYKTMVNELSNQNELLKELEVEKNRLFVENHETEFKRNQLKLMKPSITDQRTLECGRKRFDYYKVLTGIRWDYSAIKTSVKGFVTNGDDYVHPFCFDRHDEKLDSKIWKEIGKSTSHSRILKSAQKENSSPNEDI